MKNDFQIKRNIDFFSNLLSRFPNSGFRALHYSSGESQVTRFIVLAQITSWANKSVLDFGCGFGDFGHYLSKVGENCSYSGMDINHEIIKKAREKYPAYDFQTLKFNEYGEFTNRFDFGVSSGVFNLSQGSYEESVEYLKMNVKWLYNCVTEGLAFNFTTNNFGDSNIEQFNVFEIYEFSKSLCENVVLREDYLDGDATIYLYKY